MNLSCTCKGWEFRQTCVHVLNVERAILKGGSFQFPIQYRSRTNATTVYLVDCLDEK